jgi:uncharacterized Zn finger protein
MREDAATKARRLLAEGRCYVVRVSGDHVDAVIRGDTELHHIRHDGGSWGCTCPAGNIGSRRCSHIRALQLITCPSGAWIVSEDVLVQVGGRDG